MSEMDRSALEALVRQIVMEKLGQLTCPVRKIPVPTLDVTEEDRMDTGNPSDRVWTKDLLTSEQSPRLGCGLMVMEHTDFPWTLNYDELDYVLSGRLDVLINGQKVSADPGEVIYIPKGSSIRFSAEERTRFLYFVHPANWQEQD